MSELPGKVGELQDVVDRLARLQDKAIRFDLDQIGIEARERDACELVELRAELARLRAANARLRAECDAGRALVRSVQARLGFQEIAPYRATLDAARRAVDEAGDLR